MRHSLCRLALACLVVACASCRAAEKLPRLKTCGEKLDLTGAVESPAYDSGGVFPIACWVPSYSHLERWAARGINVAWYNEGLNPRTKSLAEFSSKCNSLKMKMWRYPAPYMQPAVDPSFDRTDPALAAYSLIDEPILHRKTAEDMAAQAASFRAVNPKMKLILNLEGDKFVMDKPSQKVIDQTSAYLASCDIALMDFYVKNRNADRYPLSHVWNATERMGVWSQGKPSGAFIECSNQRIGEPGREPTPAEMRGQIIGSLIYGGRLIAYFPQVPDRKANKGKTYGTADDGTPPELEREMIAINRKLQEYAPILLDRGARLTTLPAPLIGAVRWHAGKTYLMVLNNHAESPAQFNGDTLAPYDWRLYQATSVQASE